MSGSAAGDALHAGSIENPVEGQYARIQTGHIEAGRDVNVILGTPPADLIRLTEVFSHQISVSTEARVRTEARATELAAQLGFTREAVIAFFRIVGEQEVPLELLPEKLVKIATQHRSLLDRWSVLNESDPEIAELAEKARQAIEAGRYEDADALLVRAREQDISAARQAQQIADQAQQAVRRRILSAADSDEKRADLAMTRLHYIDAAQHYGDAAGLLPTTLSDHRNFLLSQQANALCHQGAERGDIDALRQAIKVYGHVLEGWTREQAPLRWAEAQNDLGIALLRLGERESGTPCLDRAVAAFRSALEENTRDRDPLGWAAIQTNLGAVLHALGVREKGSSKLEEAITAYGEALKEYARNQTPLEWATTQNNLGNTLVALGEREAGTAHMTQAITAFRAALQVRTRERIPFLWASTQNNLGNALASLGERENDVVHFKRSVAAYRAALMEWTREHAPADWSKGQHNVGNVLTQLGKRENDDARLEEAIAAFASALEERPSEVVPLQWARSYGDQGIAIRFLAERRNDLAMAERAVAQINKAFELFSDAGHASDAKNYEAQLRAARGLVERLRKL